MKLKEIKPGMVIHCKNYEEKQELLKEAERLGYRWCGTPEYPLERNTYSGMTIHFNEPSTILDYFNITWSDRTEGVTEFSDLIIPELTAEDAFGILGEICKGHRYCHNCEIGKFEEGSCPHILSHNKEEVIKVLEQWKADHEKKEPEIETVDICRIIEIQPDGRKRCVHEEDIKSEFAFGGDERQKVEEILKRYCMEHEGEFIAVHEVVSRVKAVE